MSDTIHERVQTELSVAHDEGRSASSEARAHVEGCGECRAFAAALTSLDVTLARGRFDQAPDLSAGVAESLAPRRGQWWSVAAAALVGLVAGAVIGGVGTRLETGMAQDLDQLFHVAGTGLHGLTADLLVVERGVHDDVQERVYVGSIEYVAPEQLVIYLIDTTDYPDADWVANDVRLAFADGDLVVTAGSPCPVAGMPGCLTEPSTRAARGLPPFDSGVLVPLEIVGPGRSFAWPSGLEVLGLQNHQGRPAIQVRSTVAAVELIGALVDQGAWRDFHPTDPVVMWLDEETLVPLRLEVFAADTPERELWQLRRGYDDIDDGEPILIVEISNMITEPPDIDLELPEDAMPAGFLDAAVTMPDLDLPEGFVPHRSGRRPLGDGGVAAVATWSDGRSWLMVEITDDWEEPHLFGMSLPFVTPVELGEGSVGYMAPSGDRLAIHGEDAEVLVSGSVPIELLVEVAASLAVRGDPVPDTWLEASTVEISDLPPGTLVPEFEGWSGSARVTEVETSILLSSGGTRSILITQAPGSALDAPVGPDVFEVDLRGTVGRFDAATGTLQWVEDGLVVDLQSDTVGRAVLVEVAESMERR
jgi:hypothetical protein